MTAARVLELGRSGLHVLDEGSGPAVVLGHAWSHDLTMWDDLAPRLVRGGWRVVRYDTRGHGRSPVSAPYPFAALVDDLDQLLDRLDLDRPILGGLSLGGFVALEHALQHPGRARALILADTWSGPIPSDADMTATLRRSETTAGLAAWWTERHGGHRAVAADPALVARRARFARQPAAGLASAISACAARSSVHRRLAEITAPTLVVAGAEDRFFSPAMHRDLAAAIPGAVIEVLPGAGHIAVADAPDAFYAAVQGFLVRVAPPALQPPPQIAEERSSSHP